jgi:predicted small secreted protein
MLRHSGNQSSLFNFSLLQKNVYFKPERLHLSVFYIYFGYQFPSFSLSLVLTVSLFYTGLIRSFEFPGALHQAIFLTLNTTKMKRRILIFALIAVAAFSVTSCATQKGGCKATQGFLGYGSR